jgi:hypothetical protein
MTFYINGIQGGNAELGTIDNKGLYTAPAIVPVPNSVTITAASVEHPTFPKGSASVSVLNPIPIVNAVTPSTFPEGSAQVIVNGSQFVFGAQIMWNGVAVPTTLISGTQLAAVIPAPNPGPSRCWSAIPIPDRENSATVPVVVGPGQVVLTLYAGEGSDVRVSNPLSLRPLSQRNHQHRRHAEGQWIPNGNAQIGTVSCQSRRNHHLHRAACGSHAQQRCATHHHQRRQSRRVHHAEHLRPQSDSDPQLGIAHELQCWTALHHRHGHRHRTSSMARKC